MDDEFELPEDLSYQLMSQGIQKKIMKKWKSLKKHILSGTQTDDEIKEFDNILNYYYEE